MKSISAEELVPLLSATPRTGTIYMVGIGGCGMSGLAHLLLDLGFEVAGTDLAVNREISQLRERGARIEIGHSADLLVKSSPSLVVYSSAIRLNNPEVTRALELGMPVVRRATLLAAFSRLGVAVCVAGMHGKTTTTSLLAYALRHLGSNPGFAVGAMVQQLPRHARFSGPGHYFILETDESDGTLLEFHPEFALLLNVDEEHLDYFSNLEAVCREFRTFGSQTSKQIFFCADDDRLTEIFGGGKRAISFGYHPLADYRVELCPPFGEDLEKGRRTESRFTVRHQGELLGVFQISLHGQKNISNAAAVIAFLHQQGFAAADIEAAIGDFAGAARRQQELFVDERFRVFDDYGHHPCEIEATLKALKDRGCQRLLVAFQPHRFTRTHHLLHQFATCFRSADLLWVTEVYAASEPEMPGVNGAALAAAITAQGQAVELMASARDLPAVIRAKMEPGDYVLFIGAGDITYRAHAMANQLKNEVPPMGERLLAELRLLLSADAILRSNEPLGKRTTLRVGGKADLYAEPACERDLTILLRFAKSHALPVFMLGRGSNLLIRDGGIRGVVICLAQPAFSAIDTEGERLFCGAGARLKAVAVEARRKDMTGLEFLEGIPGSVGGALRMNAGAMGNWIFEIVESVRFMTFDGEIIERPAAEVHYEYRGCPLFKTHIALGAVLKGKFAAHDEIENRASQFNQKRWSSQPSKPSAGCIFKNPGEVPAGKLVEELGLKGTRIGGAVISDIHGNFIVNDARATASDVLQLIELVKTRARESRGIELETEVQIVGENN